MKAPRGGGGTAWCAPLGTPPRVTLPSESDASQRATEVRHVYYPQYRPCQNTSPPRFLPAPLPLLYHALRSAGWSLQRGRQLACQQPPTSQPLPSHAAPVRPTRLAVAHGQEGTLITQGRLQGGAQAGAVSKVPLTTRRTAACKQPWAHSQSAASPALRCHLRRAADVVERRARHYQVGGAKVPPAGGLHPEARLAHDALDVSVPPAAPPLVVLAWAKGVEGGRAGQGGVQVGSRRGTRRGGRGALKFGL